MLFEQIESKGLAHYSYIIGNKSEAVVIDPRRDCQIYIEKASQEGLHIKHIFETHRNEDYAIGSVELSSQTGAEIWHADAQLDYCYGQPIEDGQIINFGGLSLQAIHTPGHTPGSMSYLLSDTDGIPWIVFTGDTLFAGDTGRVDLVSVDRAEEMAGMLYNSLFYKLLPLGDEVIVCPAHGSGSVCGSAISGRRITTIGHERRHNPKLQYKTCSEFISKVAVILERPPYFRRMEKLNVEGAPILWSLPNPVPLSPAEFAGKAQDAIVLDTRSEVGFGSAHVPGAISIWMNGISSFAGWFLPYNKPILLVNETNDPSQAVKFLIRLGYDEVKGYLSDEMHSWHMAGMESESIKVVLVQELCRLLDGKRDIWLLDVRSEEELENNGRIPDAHHIHITQIPERKDEIPKDKPVYIFCGSGLRSMIAASLLQNDGWQDIAIILGGLAGWNSISCPIKSQK